MSNMTIYDDDGFPIMTVDTKTSRIDKEVLSVSTKMRDSGLRFRMKGNIPVVYNKRDLDNTMPVTFLLRNNSPWVIKYSKPLVAKAIVYKFIDVRSIMNLVKEYIIRYNNENT